MATEQEKKEFALSQLAPYLANPSTCGYNEETRSCLYITNDGRMCVAGKNMLNTKSRTDESIIEILKEHNYEQSKVFKPEVVDILTTQEWENMQYIHDYIATGNLENIKLRVKQLNLFTFKELVERAETLKKVEN
jgi:hypothetical protein